MVVLGCQPCFCNGHANLPAGICDQDSGECYCTDHTEGRQCEKCAKGFFGDPTDAGDCFHECNAKNFIRNELSGHLGCQYDDEGKLIAYLQYFQLLHILFREIVTTYMSVKIVRYFTVKNFLFWVLKVGTIFQL